MTVATQTLEQQLDALIAEYGLSSLSLTRIAMQNGHIFWAANAQADGFCGSNGTKGADARFALMHALGDLQKLRAPAMGAVPELASLEQPA